MNQSFNEKREKDTLQAFKKVVRDMLVLLRTSLQAETVSMHWVNNKKEILVLEAYSTTLKNVAYQDRGRKDGHFLGDYTHITSVTRLQKNIHFKPETLPHYSSATPVSFIYLIPFVFNDETVAITSVETAFKSGLSVTDEQVIAAFQNAVGRLLQTYQELSELIENQTEWVGYDDIVKKVSLAQDPMDLAFGLIQNLHILTGKNGGVVLLARGLNEWHTVLFSPGTFNPPPIGLVLQEGTIGSQALKVGESHFSTHFNTNPKRISALEPLCQGATLAVPLMHRQRRQMLLVIYSENPLLFNDILKFKITNLCRVAGLKLEALLPELDVHDNIFSNGTSCYTKELFSGSLSCITEHISHCDKASGFYSWVGMATISNINDLRTRFRLDELTALQKVVLDKIRPNNFDVPGIAASYSDYVYTIILQSTDELALKRWVENITNVFDQPVSFSSRHKEKIQFSSAFTQLKEERNTESILQRVRKAMNNAVRNNQVFVEV